MVTIVFFRGGDGSVPFRDWFDHLPPRSKARCRARLGLLAAEGRQLRRPASDYLRDGIYGLRVRSDRVQFRVLYFFHGQAAVVVSHGFVKRESAVPPIEIERALRRRLAFEADPTRHTHEEPA